MRCVLKLQTNAAVSDVVHILSVPTNDSVKTMNCMQSTAGIKEDVSMQHRMESENARRHNVHLNAVTARHLRAQCTFRSFADDDLKHNANHFAGEMDV